jgi:outer membrane protein OmpA-like peptidoglycan-associated protein
MPFGARAGNSNGPVPLSSGLVFTTTAHTSLAASTGSVAIADTEIVYAVTGADDGRISYRFTVSAPSDTTARTLLESVPRSFDRVVRREDLRSATRLTVLLSTTDPVSLPGQTFASTSAAVLKALHGAGQVAFVLGVNEPEKGLEALAGLAGKAPALGRAGAGESASLVASGVSAMLSSITLVRHYYRGTLERVGGNDEPFSVLLDGRRTTVPAMHTRGDLTFGDRKITPEIWWLDDPDNPLTLKWAVNDVYETITRIDRGASAAGDVAQALMSRSCRSELRGVYFTTASAEVLDASRPALERFSKLLRDHPDWHVTIEGHTDNIGTAEYNLDLSARRAGAVRDVLIHLYGVPAERVLIKGYGLARPVESNATDGGRAHNRRVEVSRNCGDKA